MCEFQFFYGLNLSQRLFSISDNLSKTLQKESMSVLSGLHLAELTVKTYQKMQSDEEAELFFKIVSKNTTKSSQRKLLIALSSTGLHCHKAVSKKAFDYPFISKAALPCK